MTPAGQRLERALAFDRELQRIEVSLKLLHAAVHGEVAAAKNAVIAEQLAEGEVRALIARLEHPEQCVDAIDDAIVWLRKLARVPAAPVEVG